MPNQKLVNHNNSQCSKSVINLAPGVWTAVGYAASNVHMIEGNNSITIIDTTESTGAAENILSEFRKLTDKPIRKIIYSHSHRDHISGATVFSPHQDIPILASSLFKSDLIDINPNEIAPNLALARRTKAQFGIGLTNQERISLGCGPGNRPMEGLGAGFIPPTEFIEENCELNLDGVATKIILVPGETADHLAIWLPEEKILFPGDNWYHAFPNLYAIRGTPYRDYSSWADSLAILNELKAEVLAPGHTMPVIGANNVSEVLETTRIAILHIIKHTADGMNAGHSMDDIASTISLPSEIADKPWLEEFYGKISWATRAYAVGTLGWYDGNPTKLGTLDSVSRASHMVELAGGTKNLLDIAKNTKDLQWRLELCDHLIALKEPVELLKAETMEELAEKEINATARNTYLWEAKQLRLQRKI